MTRICGMCVITIVLHIILFLLFATVVTPRIVCTPFGNLGYRLLTIRLTFLP